MSSVWAQPLHERGIVWPKQIVNCVPLLIDKDMVRESISKMKDGKTIVCIRVSPPPSKTPPPLSCQVLLPPYICKLSNPLLFRQSPYIFWFFINTLLKLGLFPWNPKSFSSFTPSYLSKVTKFLVKVSQFEFLVTTEQRILVYKLFLSLDIPDFSLFFVKKLHLLPLAPLKKVTPYFQAIPSKNWALVKPRLPYPPFWNLVGGSLWRLQEHQVVLKRVKSAGEAGVRVVLLSKSRVL